MSAGRRFPPSHQSNPDGQLLTPRVCERPKTSLIGPIKSIRWANILGHVVRYLGSDNKSWYLLFMPHCLYPLSLVIVTRRGHKISNLGVNYCNNEQWFICLPAVRLSVCLSVCLSFCSLTWYTTYTHPNGLVCNLLTFPILRNIDWDVVFQNNGTGYITDPKSNH